MTDLLYWLLWWRLPTRRRCLVNFRDPKAPSVEGVLYQVRGPWLVLQRAALHDTSKRDPTPVDGELLVHRHLVAWLQFL